MRHIARPLALLLVLSAVPLVLAQPKTPDKDKIKLANAQSAYKAAKASFAKKPKDAKLKKRCGAATAAYGTVMMMSPSLPPREKYTGALHLYREALKYDPTNKEALENKKMIEGIYKSMGKPIPK